MSEQLYTPVYQRVRPENIAASYNTEPRIAGYPELIITDTKEINQGNGSGEVYIPEGEPVADQESLTGGLTEGGEVYLDSNVTLTSEGLSNASIKDVYTIDLDGTLDLNNKKLTVDACLHLADGNNLTIKNGVIESSVTTDNNALNSILYVPEGGSLTLENVEVNVKNKLGCALYAGYNNSTLELKGCKFNVSCFSVATNASTPPSNITINAEDCEFTATDQNVPVLINVPVNAVFKNCKFSGLYQGAIFRGGTYECEGCTFIERGESDWTLDSVRDTWSKYFRPENPSASLQVWGSGNSCPLAALTIGNNSKSAYRYPTNVTLKKCTLQVPSQFSGKGLMPALYAHANPEEGNGVTLTYDDSCKFVGDIVLDGDNITCNGKKANEG